jgi:hypothetical protein
VTASAVGRSFEARVFAVSRQGGVVALGFTPKVADSGAIRVTGAVASLLRGLHGQVRLLVLVSDAKAGTIRPLEAVSASASAGPGWRRIEIALDIEAAAP